MSQKVRIIKVRHAGASVYLGDDSCRNHCWTRNPERIMDWLCDGWRTRFNQHREHRTIRRYMEDMETHERMWVDVPLGGATVGEPFKDSEARTRFLGSHASPPPFSPAPCAWRTRNGTPR